MDELPQSVITINNLGFILFFNPSAEKLWGLKKSEVLGKQVSSLFGDNPGSSVLSQFCDPARSKSPGVHLKQHLNLIDGRIRQEDIMLIWTDLKQEIHYTLLILSPR